ncbi:hypothetical protein FKW77_008693 [Venturia effusa]|uniref:Uncharacterized protein n=1 Tax=Venturia effusa TaxID=50376 RepID=A0A517KX22_9PEZI|nr:hypothetical protein FKW77_008693 [Venturia effusa]
MDHRTLPPSEAMPPSLTSASTLTNDSTSKGSFSSTRSCSDSLHRASNNQTLAHLQEKWACQYNANLLQHKHDFLQHWANEFIPQQAVEEFVLREIQMKSEHDHWVEKQSAMFTNFDESSMTTLTGLRAKELSLIPSNLLTPERNCFMKDEDLSAIASLEKTVESLRGDNQMLNQHIQALHRQYAVSEATNTIIEQLQNQLARVENQLNTLQASENNLNQSQQRDTKEPQAGDASKNDIDLLGQSFTGKFALIEKILGIDITTTGPKPGNLLELLHNRLWYLEAALLPPHSPHYRGRQPYLPLAECVKPGCTAAHRTINYSAPPGQLATIFPHPVNGGPPQHPVPMPVGFVNGNSMQATTGLPPPSFPTVKAKLETQDVRYQLAQPPRAAHHKVPHPLQHDPSIPKGPKAKPQDTQIQTSSRVNSAEWPALGDGSSQTRPKSSNSRASSKQGAMKVSKQDAIPRPQSLPSDGRTPQSAYLKVPVQHQHPLLPQHQDPTRRSAAPQPSQPIQTAYTLQQPSPQKSGASLKAFLQTPGGFAAAPASVKKQKGMCGDENCDFC